MFSKLNAVIAALCLLTGTAFAQDSAKPTDPQIAHIALQAGQDDIEARQASPVESPQKQGRAGIRRGHGPKHTAVNKQALDLVKKLKVTPEDNDTSRALTKQAAATRAELAKLDGAAFDKAYVANEVAYHKTVNAAFETTLIPSASNGGSKICWRPASRYSRTSETMPRACFRAREISNMPPRQSS